MKFTLFYILFLIFSTIYRISRNIATRGKITSNQKISYRHILTIQMILYFGIVVGSAVEYFSIGRQINLFLSFLGFAMYLIAIFIRGWAIKSLGKYWSVYITIKEDHKLIKDGPFKYVRHPNLLCLLIELCGLCFIPNAYYSFALLWIIYFPLTLYRIRVEERTLIEKLGEEYINYKKEVYALLPYLKRKGY